MGRVEEHAGGDGLIGVEKDFVKNIKWRMKALEDGSKDPAAAHALKEQCKKDILFWINTFCFTYDPRTKDKMVPFITYPYQDEAILTIASAMDEGRDVVIEKSRDMGASWINIIVPTWKMQFHGLSSFLMVSRNEDYVDAPSDPKSLFWKIDFTLEHQPKWLKPSELKRTSMHIGNKDLASVIDGESTTGEVGRGDRRSAIFLDEFASFETKAGFNALASTRDATRCRIFNSTPKGQGNAFYKMARESSAIIIRMHWSQHPEKNKGLYCSTKNEKTGRYELELKSDWKGVVNVRRKGDAQVRSVAFPEDYPFILDGKLRSPWYDNECARAVTQQEIAQELDIDYIGSDFQFFDTAAIAIYKDKYCLAPQAIGNFRIDSNVCKIITFSVDRKGKFRFWELPKEAGRYSDDRKFVMGVDVSAGTGASNSTIAIYDKQTKIKVAEYADPNILPDDFGRFVVAVARFFNNAEIVPDRSGPTGEVLTRRIIAEGYFNVFISKDGKRIGSPTENKYGVWLNPSLRTTILQQYRDAIGRASIINRSVIAMDECLNFICKMDGTIEHSASANATDPSGARSNHGDLTIADALANYRLSENSNVEIAGEGITPVGSLAWRMKMERLEKKEKEKELSGGWEV